MSEKQSPAVTVEGVCSAVELEKRTRLPGVTLKSRCPKCSRIVVTDLGANSLYCPVVGEPIDAGGYCSDCDVDWPLMIVLRLTVEIADDHPTVNPGDVNERV